MKKLFSIFAVFAFVLTGGILLSACNDKEYVYHIPDNLEQYGIENIATSSGHITNDDKTFRFYFMERYSYDPNTLTVHFLNNAGQDVDVSDFKLESFDQNMNKKIYSVELKKAEEITITLEGKAKIETKTLSIEKVGDKFFGTDDELTEVQKANLMITLQINNDSTAPLSLEEFNTALDAGENPVLKASQALDYGSKIRITLWNKNASSLLGETVKFFGHDDEFHQDYENIGDCSYYIDVSEGRTVLKSTVTYELVDDVTMRFVWVNENFKEAKFDYDRDNKLKTGFLYYENGDHWGVPFQMFANENKIETLADLIDKNGSSVTLKIDVGTENDRAGYIAKKVSENLYNHFSLYFNGIRLSDIAPEQIEVTTKEVEHEMQDPTTEYTIVFKSIPVSLPNGTKLFEDKDTHNIELFKIVWQDFQEAMDADFVKLPLDCEYDFETVGPYFNGQNSNLGNLYFSGTGSELQYVFKDQEVEYNFGFMTADEIGGYRKSAIGKTFKISIGNQSQTIVVTDSGDVETHEFDFDGEKITLTFNPQDYAGEDLTVPRIRATGTARAFASAGSMLKFELVA